MIDASAQPGRFPLVPLAVLILLAIIGVIVWQRPRSNSRSLVLGALTLTGVAYVAIGQIDVLDGSGGSAYFGPPLADASAPPGVPEGTVVDVGPNQVFPVAITLLNTGYVPVTIQGLDVVRGTPTIEPQYVGVRLLRDPNVVDPVNGAVAFQPTGVARDEMLTVVALIDPGPCARSGGSGGWYSVSEMPIAYDVLGWPRTSHVQLPLSVVIPAADSCPVSAP